MILYPGQDVCQIDLRWIVAMEFGSLNDGQDICDALAALVWPDGTKGLTENGIDDLQSLLADIRTWDGGIRQFLVDEQCDPEMIARVMADELSRKSRRFTSM